MSPRVTIGVDAHVLTGKYQGTRSTLTNLLRALGGRPDPPRLLVYTEDPAAARAAIGVAAFDYVALPALGAVRRLLDFPRLFRRDGVTIGVFQYIAPLAGRHAVFVHDILPLTHPRHFPLAMRVRMRVLGTLAIRRARVVLAVSEHTRAAVLARFRLPPERVRVVLNGPSFATPAYAGARPATPRYILSVGRIERRKNVGLLIAAFRKADLADVRLVIVGAVDAGFAFAPPCDPRIDLRSRVDEAELIGLYRGASLFVYPSAAEGFGLPLLDATLFGIPTIASNRTALPEVGGDLVRYFDPEAADAVTTLAAQIAGHFGASPIPAPDAAQRRAQAERFCWTRAADAFLAAIDAR
ncbi:glycosyltransferase family 1 protein [Sphingomonas sp. H39-1-10]|uniref:glycosyltransferase family 4 protein n=1 Tax=Sphingomonas pollutisoli TaxID=3030829 RepID=UPI0023B94946|nr:glycosyltransferase family 1 protein [Sphingomonas pollutisoli]MDF0490654.1 glycosyltransferase family 1 protein [Sphingomonas pollutisoli]